MAESKHTPGSTLKRDLMATRERIIAPDAWAKGKYEHGRAIPLDVALDMANRDASYANSQFLRKFVPDGMGLASFNDHPGTTHADVIALLDSAIEAAEGSNA